MKILVGKSCSACDKLKHYIEQNNIDIETVHEDTQEWEDLIRDMRIMSKPTLIDWDTFYTWDDIYNLLKW